MFTLRAKLSGAQCIVIGPVCGGRAGGRCPNSHRTRSVCVSLSAFFIEPFFSSGGCGLFRAAEADQFRGRLRGLCQSLSEVSAVAQSARRQLAVPSLPGQLHWLNCYAPAPNKR